MVDQVDKIVYNVLAAEHALSIPAVGSLCVERQPARRLSKRRIAPPYYAVVFTSRACGTSLTDAIAAAAGCDVTAAREICDRWLSHTMQEGVLTIGGVGVLRQKSFAVDSLFDKVLNPQGHMSVTVHATPNHWMLWVMASIAMVCGVGVCGWILYDRSMSGENLFSFVGERAERGTTKTSDLTFESAAATSQPEANGAVQEGMEVTSTQPEAQTSAPSGSQTTAVQPAQSSAASVASPPVQSAAQPRSEAALSVERTVKGCSYVVLGVFSTERNARGAVREVLTSDPALACGIYFYGDKFMVSVFSSEDAAACMAFVKAHTDLFPEAWCYKAR